MRPVVMHLIDSFRQGGSESQALNLYLEMKKSGWLDVKLACLDRSGPLLMKLPPADSEVIPEFKLNNFYDVRMCLQLYRFVRLLKQLKVEVVHTHDFYTNIFGMLAAVIAGVPVRIASRREGQKRGRVKRFVERLAYGASSAVVANCDRIRNDLVAEGIAAKKVVTVFNGVSVESFQTANTGLAAQTPHPGVVTIVANLRPVKDHAMFLRAGRRVVERCRATSFVIAGEGELEGSLRQMAAASGLAGNVQFIGRCDDVPALLKRSDICVLSSKSEGFSNAVLEYMAAGRPVVATLVGGIDEAVTDGYNGFLVDPGDDFRMADAINLLLENPAMARTMGERSREIIIERFSRQRQLEKVEQLYRSLLTQNADAFADRPASQAS